MATEKQKKAIKKVVENGGNVSKAMRDAGYSAKTAKTPKKLTESKTWNELMNEYLPQKDLIKVHKSLLNSHRIEHMVFPLNIKDAEIVSLMETVNCTVRKFMHSETMTHIWFWSPDNKAKKEALDMAYKLRGSYAPEKKDINFKDKTKDDLAKELADELADILK